MTEHDNPDGPCSCGAWHKPGETDTPEQELRESAEQPYPFNDLEKRYAAELLRVRKERNDYLGCLEVVLRDINCSTSRSWHCRNNYRQIPVEAEFKEVFPDQDYGKPFRNQWLWHEQYYGCAERSVGRSGCWDAPLEMSDFFVSEADALRAVEAWEQDRRDHLMKQIDRSFELTVLATHRLRQLQ